MADIDMTLARLIDAADDLTATSDSEAPSVSTRLHHSVIRPLRVAQAALGEESLPRDAGEDSGSRTTEPSPTPSELDERLWELATAATALRVSHSGVPELAEATAALQDLGTRSAAEPIVADRLDKLAALQSDMAPGIVVADNGPYLLTNPRTLVDWLGQPVPVRPQMALCRCGASASKPLCDGTHARIGFTAAKDPNRVADRSDTYVGQQVTILDNRGTCQHAGFCTDRLAAVFHLREEPFVTASGGRMDEIIRAVRDCPSGALSYAVDGVEARDDVDRHGTRQATVEVAKDGPYRVTGGFPLADHNGSDAARNAGASFEHYALCRCGQSQNKPFCSGMHWNVGFADPVADADHQPTIFEWAGGLPALTRMTRLFYERHVPEDPLLSPLFATMSADHPERVSKWLGEVFCGPKAYSGEFGGYTRMISEHVGKCITEEQRARWVELLLRSAREAGLPNDAEFRSAFGSYIEWGSRLAFENSQANARPPSNMPMPHWDWSTSAGPPGSRVSALASPAAVEAVEATLPGENEPVGFDAHIKALFRSSDRRSMQFAFDLWSFDDVSGRAAVILARLEDGTMPCDGAWPEVKVNVFRRWVEGETRP